MKSWVQRGDFSQVNIFIDIVLYSCNSFILIVVLDLFIYLFNFWGMGLAMLSRLGLNSCPEAILPP